MSAPISRTRERVVGALIGLGGVFLVGYGWWALSQGAQAQFITAFAGPFFAVTGLSLLVVPGFRSEQRAGDEKGSNGGGLTPRWRLILVTALVLGLANYILARSGWTPL